MNESIALTLPEALHTELKQHLFPGDCDEHGAVIAVGWHRKNGRLRLLGQRLFCACDDVDYLYGVRGYRKLRAEFIGECLAYCREQGLGYLAVHNHGGTHSVAFSSVDLASHERGYPALLDILQGPPVGALVFARGACAGDIWLSHNQRQALDETCVLGATMKRIYESPPSDDDRATSRYHRQSLMFGAAGQTQLQKTKVVVIGLGGMGSLLVEYLAKLGVGHLVLIDPDRVERSNLPRLIGATRWDARWPFDGGNWPQWLQRFARNYSALKTTVASRLARLCQPGIKITALAENVAHHDIAQQCLDSDFLFLAADSMQARLVFNAMVHQFLIPGLQLGSKVVLNPDTHELIDAYSVVRWVLPGFGCLWCNGLISPYDLALEAKTDEERRSQDYGTRVPDPSVITLNAIAASFAANEFLTSQLGLLRGDTPATWHRFHHLTREALIDIPRKDLRCPECGNHSDGRFGKGDTMPLPTIARQRG